jgi:hypothetical protein
MGHEKVLYYSKYEIQKYFSVFTGYLWLGFETSESSNIQVHTPSSDIMILLTMYFLERSC